MTNKVIIRNNTTFTEITTIENIMNPVVYEEINGSYTFSFDVAYFDTQYLVHPNLIEVEGQYYRINRVAKEHNTTISVRVDCEHISYELITKEDFIEEYDDTATGIINSILSNTGFVVGTVMATGMEYYKPPSTSVRQRLFDLAELFGGELIFDNFTVSLIPKRGQNNGLKFELGENLVGVSQEIDNSEGYPVTTYEVDVIDLSQIKGYENFAKVNLGDTIQVIDPLLAINVTYRVLSYERDPFQKINPKIQIGNLIRTFTDYIREEKENEEVDPTENYFLKRFNIGNVNCLGLSGIELDTESVIPDNISASVDYFINGEHKGLTIDVKPEYASYHVIVTKFYDDGSFEEYDLPSISDIMGSWKLPESNLVGLSITVSEVPLEELNLEIHQVRDYAVNFNKVYIDPLREFRIGKKNVLGLSGLLIDTNGENLELEDFSAVMDYHLMQEYEGVKLSLKNEFKDYKVTIMSFSSDGIPIVYDYETIKTQLPTWKLPREDAEFLLVSVSEAPSVQFDPSIHKNVVYGIKFEKIPFEALSQLRVGDTDCLTLSGIMLSPSPTLSEIQAEIFFSEMEELKGLKLNLKREYRSYYVSITTRNKKGIATTHSYDEIKGLNFPNKNVTSMVIQVLEKPPNVFDSTKHKQAWYGFKFVKQSDEPIDDYDESGARYYIESEKVKASSMGAQFDFSVPYDDVISVTLGVGKVEQQEPVTPYWSLIIDDANQCTGVSVDIKGLLSGEVEVSIQAVCQEGVIEEEGELNG